ncbi:MAG: hypothetical protein HGA98_04685, partial [Deltaproteobacteria bacterium]|nr:hypothetical protein [Deltaproteobacteria bacterium]
MVLVKRVAAAVLAVALGLAWLFDARVGRYVRAPIPADAPRVAIPRGAGLREVARILREEGVAPWELGTTLG